MTSQSRRAVSLLDLERVDALDVGAAEPHVVVFHEGEPIARSEPTAFVVDPRVADADSEIGTRIRFRLGSTAPPVAVAVVPDGRIDTSVFVACDADGDVFEETLRTRKSLSEVGWAIDAWPELEAPAAERPVRRLEGTGVLLGAQSNNNYFHWLVGNVSRVEFVRRSALPGPMTWVVPRLNSWQRQTLEAAGLRPDELLEVDGTEDIAFERLVVVTRGLSRSPHFSPAAIEAVRQIGPQSDVDGRRLWISRAKARRRRVHPTDEIEALVARHGFESIVAEDLSVADQIRLHREADVVLATHGAGLGNMVFCRPGSLILELQPEGFDYAHTVVYWSLATASGLAYGAQVCPRDPRSTGITREADILVDPELLDAFLDVALERHEDSES